MLQVVHYVIIVLTFLAVGSQGMETAMPTLDSIWGPISQVSTLLIGLLGLVAPSIVAPTLGTSSGIHPTVKTDLQNLLREALNDSVKAGCVLLICVGAGTALTGLTGCPNPAIPLVTQVQNAETVIQCVSTYWGQPFLTIENACAVGQEALVADVIVDLEQEFSAASASASALDAGTVSAVFYLYSSDPRVLSVLKTRNLVFNTKTNRLEGAIPQN